VKSVLGFLFFISFSGALTADGDFMPLEPAYKAAEEQKWNDHSEYSETEISSIKPSTGFTAVSPLELIVVKGSEWTPELIVSEFRRVEQLYSQCQVSFSPVTLVQAKYSLPNDKQPNDLSVAGDSLMFPKDVLKTRPAVLFRRYGISYSIPQARLEFLPTAPPHLVDVAVVSYFSWNYAFEYPPPHPGYSVFAHELAHVLLNVGHNQDDGNILCGTEECKGTTFSEAQCKELRAKLKK
jgi:hypothetical protein